MRLIKFGADNVANELASLSDTDLDSLAFGAVELDRDGKILRYNAAEAEISGRQQEGMIGRDFFAEVAPCTRSDAFEGRFRAGVEAYNLDVQFTYVLDYEMAPTEVRVHMRKAENRDTYWVLIKRVPVTAAR
jgi:photoactive yellow protein